MRGECLHSTEHRVRAGASSTLLGPGSLLALLLAALCSCGGSPAAPLARPPAPAPAELAAQLNTALQALGRDPAKLVLAAPTGAENAVFDLRAEAFDPDGAGPLEMVAVRLSWTERLVGDYDQNGAVNVGDLTALSQFWLQKVYYLPPPPGGVPWVPDTSQLPDPPELQWRRARVDGDANGEINAADVTPLARHFGEQLSGYRIYRRAVGESEFQLLTEPDNPASPLSIARVKAFPPGQNFPDPFSPVRYLFQDTTVAGFANYEYYVAPYDAHTAQEGPRSESRFVAVAINQPPVVALTANPSKGQAPLTVALAVNAYDPDGDSLSYTWDLDGSGPQAEFVSSSATQQATYTASGVVRPQVTVTDEYGASTMQAVAVRVDGFMHTWGRPWGDAANCLLRGPDGSLYVGGYSAQAYYGRDALVAKFTPAGEIEWLYTWNPDPELQLRHEINGLWLDADGELWAVGSASPAGNSYDPLLLCFDAAGQLKLQYIWPEPGLDKFSAICAAPAGGHYVCGSSSLPGGGNSDVLLAWLDADGTPLVLRRAGDGTDEFGYEIARSSAGELYIYGLGQEDYSSAPSGALLLKYDPAGTLLFSRLFRTNGHIVTPSSLVLAADDALYISGTDWTQSSQLTSAFVARLDPTGEQLWARELALDPIDGVNFRVFSDCLAPAANGNLYLAAGASDSSIQTQDYMLLTQLDAAGTLLDLQRMPDSPSGIADLAWDPAGSLTLCGTRVLAGGQWSSTSGALEPLTLESIELNFEVETGFSTGMLEADGVLETPAGVLDSGGGQTDLWLMQIAAE